LLREIQELRKERRELKQRKRGVFTEEEPTKEELEGLSPEDTEWIDKILKNKGYVTRDELYRIIEQEEINKFLEKYPEFKPENDPDDRLWNALQEELKWYRKPENPRDIGKLLEKARRAIQVPTGGRSSLSLQKRVEIASKGSGGKTTQRSSSSVPLSRDKIEELRRGGFTDEEIEEMLGR